MKCARVFASVEFIPQVGCSPEVHVCEMHCIWSPTSGTHCRTSQGGTKVSSVKHRYSDFDALRDHASKNSIRMKLCTRHEGGKQLTVLGGPTTDSKEEVFQYTAMYFDRVAASHAEFDIDEVVIENEVRVSR